MKSIPRIAMAMAILLTSAHVVRADNWPLWRGPTNNGVSKEENFPTDWSATKNVLWKVPLPGMGGSTPVVWGQHIFLTSQDGSDLVVLCINTDGKTLWKHPLGKATSKVRGDEGNGASASPSTDGKHVFAFVSSGELACLDFEGKEVWRFNLQDRYGKFKIQFGMHSTPVLYGACIYLQLIHSGGAHVVALKKADGKEVWKVNRPSDGRAECEHSYASPCIWQGGKEATLIVHGNDYTTAHCLEDGKEVWRLGDLNSKQRYNSTLRFVSSPVATSDLLVVPTAKNGPVVGVKPDAKGLIEAGSSYEQWRRQNNTPDVPSPLVVDGLVYLCRENGFLLCLDAKTGKEYYSRRTHDARYRASPVYGAGKVYLTARDGTVTVVKAGPEYMVLATNQIPDQVSASPALANGRIYLRGFEALYAIGTKE